jgi:hypothetical protein
MERTTRALFQEEQEFRQGWIWALLIAGTGLTVVLFGYAMYQQFVLGKPWGDEPMSDAGLAVMGPAMILLMVGLLLLFLKLKLVTEVREDGVHVLYRPLTKRHIAFEEIESCEARTYSAIREYGGWGIKFGPGGKAYNVRGNQGAQLRLKNGSRLLIGSQQADRLADAIRSRL